MGEETTNRHGFSLRRSHLEIRMDILSCVKAGAEKPTQIMYKANLSWSALQGHLNVLEGGSLVRAVEGGTRRRYELSDKGVVVLMAYRKIIDEVNAPASKPTPEF